MYQFVFLMSRLFFANLNENVYFVDFITLKLMDPVL